LDIEPVEAELAKQRMLAGKKLDPVQQIAQGKARDKAADTVGVNRQYVSNAKKISKTDRGVADLVRDGTINLLQGRKLIALPEKARPTRSMHWQMGPIFEQLSVLPRSWTITLVSNPPSRTHSKANTGSSWPIRRGNTLV
jgi:hypothetical protein